MTDALSFKNREDEENVKVIFVGHAPTSWGSLWSDQLFCNAVRNQEWVTAPIYLLQEKMHGFDIGNPAQWRLIEWMRSSVNTADVTQAEFVLGDREAAWRRMIARALDPNRNQDRELVDLPLTCELPNAAFSRRTRDITSRAAMAPDLPLMMEDVEG